MRKLVINEEWSITYDETDDNKPMEWMLHGVHYVNFDRNNAPVYEMFHALLKETTSSEEEPDINKTHPRMWEVGDVVTQLDGKKVLIVEMSNVDNSYESVGAVGFGFGDDPDALTIIHRYNRRDYGRVTGTPSAPENQMNFIPKGE